MSGDPRGKTLQGQGCSCGAGKAHQHLSSTDVHPVGLRAGIQLLRRSARATPTLRGSGARAAAPAPPPSNLDHHGRTDISSRSTAGSGMSFLTPSCSWRWRKQWAWPIAGAGSKYPQDSLGPPGAYAPGGSSTRSCSMITTIHSPQMKGVMSVQWRRKAVLLSSGSL